MIAEQLERMRTGSGFIAALDQSGGSTPKALRLYGIEENAYGNDEQMFDLIHEMRSRIMTNSAFTGDKVLGAILFLNTMNRTVEGQPSSQYLWRQKQIVPFLKVDLGLADENRGVQVMKPITGLDEVLPQARAVEVFGTKMRSVIKQANADGIRTVVAQQFEIAEQIRAHDLVPIIEPEVDIHAPDKTACEELLRTELASHLQAVQGNVPVMFKLTLPEQANFYQDFCDHPQVARVVALSGGYSRDDANARLAENHGMIASFSRALTEGLNAQQSEAEFTTRLGEAVTAIAAASAT